MNLIRRKLSSVLLTVKRASRINLKKMTLTDLTMPSYQNASAIYLRESHGKSGSSPKTHLRTHIGILIKFAIVTRLSEFSEHVQLVI